MTIELPPDRIIDPKEATRPGGRQQTPSKQMGHRGKGGWGGPPDFAIIFEETFDVNWDGV